jgi:hypothetical protein
MCWPIWTSSYKIESIVIKCSTHTNQDNTMLSTYLPESERRIEITVEIESLVPVGGLLCWTSNVFSTTVIKHS